MRAASKNKGAGTRAAGTVDPYRNHFDNARDIQFTLGRGMFVKLVSPSVERILGYRPEELMGRRLQSERLVPPGQAAGLKRLIGAAMAGKETGPVVCELKAKGGGSRMMEITAGQPAGRGAGRLLAVSARDITEWQRMADAVRQSEAKYRALVEATDTGYVIIDSSGLVLDANREYVRLTGRRSLAAIMGKHVAEWTAPRDRERNRAEVIKCLRRGSVRMLEVDYVHPDGTLVPVEINATVVEGEAGPQIVSVCRDITRRRDVEAALRDSERQFRMLVQNQGEGIGIVDHEERFVFANPAAEEIIGCGPGGLIGHSLREYTSPEQYAEAVRQTGLRRQGVKSTYELGIIRHDGQARLLLVTATPQRDRQGQITGTFGIFRDITERKRSEEALRASEQRYRALVETSPDAILVSDLDGKIVAANRMAAEMHGIADPARLIGLDVYGFIVPEDRPRAADNARKVLTGKPVERVEYRMLRHDGSAFDGELSASILPGADGRPAGFMAVVQDVTERNRAEAALRESEERLRFLGDNMPGIFFYQVDTGADGKARRFTYISDGVEKLHETTVAAALKDQQKIYGAICKEHRKALEEKEAAAIAAMAPFSAEARLELPSGRERWMHYVSIPQRKAGRHLWDGIGIDITERKLAETAMRESEERYRRLVEQLPDAVYIYEGDRFAFANDAGVKLLGADDPDQLMGRALTDFLHPDHHREAKVRMGRLYRKGESAPLTEQRLVRLDGREIDINVKTIPFPLHGKQMALAIVRDITQRKQAERALQESQDWLRFLGDNLPGMLFYQIDSGPDGRERRFTFLSEGCRRLHEITAAQALADPMAIYGQVCREHQALVGAREAESAESLSPLNVEVMLNLPSGRGVWRQFTSIPRRLKSGRLVWDGIEIDITERKRSEEALRASEQRYRLLAENSNDLVWTSDLDNNFTYVSPSVQRLQGFTVEEAMEMGMEGLVAPGSLELLRSIHREGAKVLASGPATTRLSRAVDLECRHKALGTIWCEVTAMVLTDEKGRPTGILGVNRDITERKRAEQALRESEEKYRTLINQASDGIMLMPVGGAGFTVNESFAKMHGYDSPGDMEHLRLEDLDTPESAKLIGQRLERMLAGEHLSFEVEHYHRDGHAFPLRVSCSVIRIGKQAYFLGFHSDITDRKRLEKEVLEVGDRVQYQIGHDLHDGINQLLTSATLRVGALRQKMREGRLPDEGELAALADLTRQTMDQVSALARGLSPLSIKSGGLALGLAELAKATSSLGIECRTAVDEGVEVQDLAEATHLYRIAQEAVNNALKHAKAGSITISLRRQGDNAVLSIADDGRGLPQSASSHRGMGLNIMKYRAGLIGADLEIVPARDRGTEVRCRFRIGPVKERE